MLNAYSEFEPTEMEEGGLAPKGDSTASDSNLVYVVDDEPLVAQVVASMLEYAGLNPVVFDRPQTALKAFLAANPRPALVITDFVMNPLNGMELIARLKEAEPGLKTILYSGSVGADIFKHHLVKPDRFLSKPMELGPLIALVRDLVNS